MTDDKPCPLNEMREKSCPCEFEEIEPCNKLCSCRNQFHSGGCNRCCRYGSPEQKLAAARMMVAAERQAKVPECIEGWREWERVAPWRVTEVLVELWEAGTRLSPLAGDCLEWLAGRPPTRKPLSEIGGGRR